MPFDYWIVRSAYPAAVTFVKNGGGFAVFGPLRLLSADEQNAAGRAFGKFCKLTNLKSEADT